MLIGYMRVSKADGSQTTDLQRDALIAASVDPAHLYEDQASGKREDRAGLMACIKALRPGDTLVVWKLDRLGRNLRHLINTVHGWHEAIFAERNLTWERVAIPAKSGLYPHQPSAERIGVICKLNGALRIM